MKKILNSAKKFSPSIVALMLPALAFAQSFGGPAPYAPGNSNVPQANIFDLQGVLGMLCVVFAWAFYFLIVLAVIFVIIAAFKYLTAAGEPEKVKEAGTMLLYTAVAIGVALLARAIPLVIGNFLGAGAINSC
jgi:uncharacterized membrane protein